MALTTLSTSPQTGEVRPLHAATSPALLILLFLAVSCGGLPPTPIRVHERAAPTSTAAVSTLAELVRAHNAGGAAEIRRVLAERWRDRGAADHQGAVVVGSVEGDVPLALVVRLNDLPTCSNSGAGVVVEDPARLIGCGAQDLSALAAFVLAAEASRGVALVVADDDEALARALPRAGLAWTGGGLMLQGTDIDVFDVEAVDVGGFSIDMHRPDGDPSALVVAAGRAAAWTSTPMVPLVIADRWARLPRPWWNIEDLLTTLLASPTTVAQVREGCRIVAVSTASARLWCSVLPGHVVDDVRDAVVLAVDDDDTVVTETQRRTPTATNFSMAVVRVLETRLQLETSRAVTVPALRTSMVAGTCDALRRRGTPCVGGVPLLVHPVERARAGADDEAVGVQALTLMTSRVVDAVDTLVGAS